MAKGAVSMRLEGLEELKEQLFDFTPREAHNLLRATVHGTAGKVRDGMRKRAPKDSGDLSKAIFTQRRRGTPTEIVSEVRIRHGKGQKLHAWYWHFQEFGTTNQPAQPFIVPAVEEFGPKLPGIFREQFAKKLEKALARRAKK